MTTKKNVLIAGLTSLVLLASVSSTFAAQAVATGNVNVRSGPGTGYGVITALRRGDSVEVTGCQGGWCYVEKRGPDGWVSANYLSARNRASQPSISFRFSFGNTPNVPRPPRHPRPDQSGPGHNGGWGNNGGWDNDGGWGNGGGHNDGPDWPRYN